MTEPTPQGVADACRAIGAHVRQTPLVRSRALSGQGRTVHLKLENLQETGAFKVRGAAHKLLSLSREEKERGVVTVSTGNHGRAVAHVAGRLGMRAVVFISRRVPANKVRALQETGAEVHVVGDSQDEAAVRAEALSSEEGLTMVHPFDDPRVIEGQGTIGAEILEALPEVDAVVVPLSGGGLLSGVALAVKASRPDVRVIGVSAERAPVMLKSLEAKHPVELPEEETIADSLAGGVGLDNRYTFRMVRDLVDDHVVVTEAQIARAMAFARLEEGQVLEGAGAAGLAAMLQHPIPGEQVVVVASGGNVDEETLRRVSNGG